VTVNPFNVIEPVEYLKGTVGSKPFKNHFAGWKNRADCDGADTAYPAYVLVPHQMKYAHHGVLFFSGAPAGFVSDHSLGTSEICAARQSRLGTFIRTHNREKNGVTQLHVYAFRDSVLIRLGVSAQPQRPFVGSSLKP
jgi:hypothetical protein